MGSHNMYFWGGIWPLSLSVRILDSPMLLRISTAHSLLLWGRTPSLEYTAIRLSIHLSVDIWVVTRLGRL